MNFIGQNLYAFDQSYHLHNNNSVEYVQGGTPLTAGVKDDNYRGISNQLLTNNFVPMHQTTDPQYVPLYDPYMTQMPQTISTPLYPMHGMAPFPNGNNSINYPYNYPSAETNIDRCYLGMHNQSYIKAPEYYNPVMNFNQIRPYIPQINYQSNQITVVPNIQISSNDSISYSANNYIEITQNANESVAQYQDVTNNRVVSYRSQDNHRRIFKSQRNKIKSTPLKSGNSDPVSFVNKSKSSSSLNHHLSNTPIPDDALESNNDSYIEVLVTNLDYNIGAKEWKKLLYNQFQSALKRVHSVYIQTQTDGSNCALVRVNSIEDARLAISQFHRKKIGYKRIQVNLVNSNINLVSGNMKQEVASLLKSVAGYSLSVFKFMELYEKRYHRNISISDFYKMKDFVEIKDVGGNQNGKIISLTNTAINYIDQAMESTETGDGFESSICTLHCKEGTDDYLLTIDSSILPNVEIKLKLLKDQVYKILQSHNGDVPLMSFMSCYKVDFDDIRIMKSQNIFTVSENIESDNLVANNDGNEEPLCNINKGNDSGIHFDGVPLEHLLSCIPGIKITTAVIEVRKIQWEDKKDIVSTTNNGLGGVLVDRLHQFSREVVDLIKHQSGCRILLSKFIPTYHHHFGKQCRVADYGFSKLHELIDALPQVVHVIGFGYMRILYLSHKVQVRRFTNELMKVLKSQNTKTCTLSEYPHLYKMLFHKDFNVTDYGVCYLDDLIEEIPDSTVEILKEEHDIYVSMPKRIQTPEEKERTTQFAIEVVDLLKETPRCKLPFNKFIPSYHHHFSRQCKVAEYGFTKLIELLEAIPFVVQIVEEHGEKYVLLTQYEMLRVFGDQTLNILEKSFNKRVELSEFSNVYLKTQGYPLNLEDFMVTSIKQLITRIPKVAKIQSFSLNSLSNSEQPPGQSEESNEDSVTLEVSCKSLLVEKTDLFICLADRNYVKYLAHKVLLVLLEVLNGSLPDYQFIEKYHYKYREEPNITTIQEELYDIVQVVSDPTLLSCQGSSGFNIRLKPLILFSRDLKELIKFNQGKMPLMQLEPIYEQQYGISLKPQEYGYPSLLSLIQACDFVVTVKGRGIRATLILNQDFVGKLAYRVAYSTEPFINAPISDSDDISYQMPANNNTVAMQPLIVENYDQSMITGHMTKATSNQIPPSGMSPKSACMAPMIYNHYMNTQTNFLPAMNSYSYFNAQPPMYNAWFRQWYQPHASYGYPPSMYPSSDYGVLPLTQGSLSQATISQTCTPYLPVASQDQKQIDELVETLAYDNSCSSRITPPPSSLQHLQHQSTFDSANTTIIANPWMAYPIQQLMSPHGSYHAGYQTALSSTSTDDTNQPSDPLSQSHADNTAPHGTNNNSIVKTRFSLYDSSRRTETFSFSSHSQFCSQWNFTKSIS